MIPGVAQTVDGATRSHGRLWTRCRERSHAEWRACGALLSVIAALLLIPPAQAQERTLQIGVLALGPRKIPAWQCGEEGHQLALQERRHETMPFYVLGMIEELGKLNYVRVGPDGKPMKAPSQGSAAGRRFFLDLRTGSEQQLRAAARELAQKEGEKKIDVIVAVATLAVRIAQQETRGSSIPILMTGVSEPVNEGFVQSLAQPGGSITGVSHQLMQGSGKRVELFKEMLPRLQRLMTIRVPGYSVSEKSMPEIRAAADRLKIEVLDRTVKTRPELQAVLADVRADTVDGTLISPDSFIISNADMILENSLARRVPSFGLFDYMAAWGAIAAYGPSAFQQGMRVAGYVDKISKGAKPEHTPVEPVDPTFVINLKAAACHGISVPYHLQRQADRVIR